MQLQATIAAKALMRQKKIKPLIKKLTKTEKKACEDFATKLRETELEEWVTNSDSDDFRERRNKDGISVPSHYKKYTVKDRKILMQLPDRQNEKNKSYDGPEDAKKIDIAEPGKESRSMYIATNLTSEEERELIKLL